MGKCQTQDCEEPARPRGKYCMGHKKGKTCKETDCAANAISRTDFCRKHGSENQCQEPVRGESNRTSLKCQTQDCEEPARPRGKYCMGHKKGKTCKEDDCTANAVSPTDFCIKHGGGKRCQEPGCDSSAESPTDFCVKHGGGKRCQEPDCKASARSPTDFCVKHGGGKPCQEPDCKASARSPTDFCVKHGGGKPCQEPDCKASAQSTTDFCVKHGGGKRCPNCIDWIDSRSGTKKYDGYCATCFKHLFPLDKRANRSREKSHEMKVMRHLNEHFPDFIHDQPIQTSHCDCTHRRRIDFRMLIEGTLLAVEVDERQHRSYDEKDEEDRYNDLFMAFSGKWVFIRFNPDSYLKKGKRENPKIEKRFPALLQEITAQISRIKSGANTNLVETIKLFYNS